MANWCSTSIVITNSDLEKIKNLSMEFDKAFESSKIENGFGNMWLGNILSHLGYEDEVVVHGRIKCRGEVVYKKLLGNELRICTETAWVPMLEPFIKMVEKYAPDSDITYYAEESGFELFYTNDLSLVGRISVDVFETLPEELAWLDAYDGEEAELLGKIAESMDWNVPEDEIENKISEEGLDELFALHKWEYAEVSEW